MRQTNRNEQKTTHTHFEMWENSLDFIVREKYYSPHTNFVIITIILQICTYIYIWEVESRIDQTSFESLGSTALVRQNVASTHWTEFWSVLLQPHHTYARSTHYENKFYSRNHPQESYHKLNMMYTHRVKCTRIRREKKNINYFLQNTTITASEEEEKNHHSQNKNNNISVEHRHTECLSWCLPTLNDYILKCFTGLLLYIVVTWIKWE